MKKIKAKEVLDETQIENKKAKKDWDKGKALRTLGLIYALVFLAATILWGVRGALMYQGITYYVTGNAMPDVENVTFSFVEGNTYRAMVGGILPAGDVRIIQRDRIVVNCGLNGIISVARGAYPLIVSFSETNKLGQEAGLQIGDRIIEYNGTAVHSNAELIEIQQADTNDTCEYTILRDDKTLHITSKMDEYNKVGINIRDSQYVFGTMSFTKDGYFYAFGHQVYDADITDCAVAYVAYDKDETGEIKATRALSDETSTIETQSLYGAIGKVGSDWLLGDEVEIAWSWEIKPGKAYLLVNTNDGSEWKEIELESVDGILLNSETNEQSVSYKWAVNSKDISFVRGMSGSPIIQNGRLIGILTAVDIADVHKGFMLSAQTAYEYFEKATKAENESDLGA